MELRLKEEVIDKLQQITYYWRLDIINRGVTPRQSNLCRIAGSVPPMRHFFSVKHLEVSELLLTFAGEKDN